MGVQPSWVSLCCNFQATGPLLTIEGICVGREALLEGFLFDIIAGGTRHCLVEQPNGSNASICLLKRSLCQLYNTGLIAELKVTKTMLVVCTAEYSCCVLNEEMTYTARLGIQQIA